MSEVVNTYPILRKAAHGDLEALRTLAALGKQQGDPLALIEGLVFARLAYARSGETFDAGLQMELMGLAGTAYADEDARFTWHAEMIALVSRLADEHEPVADQHMNWFVETADRETAQAAQEIAALMAEEGA